MNLRNRTLLILTPVLALVYLATGEAIYQAQKQSILTQEQMVLASTLNQAKGTYDSYTRLTQSLLYAIESRSTLNEFIHQDSTSAREVTLARELQRGIKRLSRSGY